MTKNDHPSIDLIVKNGALYPTTQYEEEVVASYKNGSRLVVILHQPKDNRAMRKLHAVLRLVIDQCQTPWRSIDQAKQSLKVALGFTTHGILLSGKPFLSPMPMSKFDQRDLDDFIEGCWRVIEEITGVDPLTLTKESADVGSDEPNKPDTGDSTADEVELVKEITIGLAAAVCKDVEIMDNQARAFKGQFMQLSDDSKAKIGTIKKELLKLSGENPTGDKKAIVEYVSGISGVPVEDIMKWVNE